MKFKFNRIQCAVQVTILVALGISILGISAESFVSQSAVEVSNNNADFNMKLFEATKASRHGKNFLISPFSLSNILAMLTFGADGITAREIKKGLGFQNLKNESTIYDGYSSILFSLHENTATTVNIANRMYITDKTYVKSRFIDILEREFYTKAITTNFARKYEIEEDINNWVQRSTSRKMSSMISAEDIRQNMQALIVNVIYFRGIWKEKFDTRDTQERDFTSEKGIKQAMLFMKREADFQYVDLPDIFASAIAMPFEGDRFSLIVVLPNYGEKLQDVEQSIRDENFALTDIPKKMSKKFIKLIFPRLRLEKEIDFAASGVLSKLNMKSMISTRGASAADFSRISTDSQIHIDAIMQKCFLDITEHGIDAPPGNAGKDPFSTKGAVLFSATQPFMAYIYDRITNTVLFVFRITERT